jgi:hypothetical protein
MMGNVRYLVAAVFLSACMGELVGPRSEFIPPVVVGGGSGATGGGVGSGGGTAGGGGTPVRQPWFQCTPGADPSPEVVLRLTPEQYRRTLDALLGRTFSRTQRDALFASLATHLAALPVDGSTHRAELTWDTMDQRISPLLVNPQFEIATATGSWIAGDAQRLSAFATTFGGSACASNVTSQSCVDAVIEGFGQRALRRPLDNDDRTSARGAFADTTWGGYRAIIASFLLSPDFLFRTEFRGEPIAGRTDLTQLTSYEIANRVAFTLTNTMPDDALLAAAAANFQGDGLTLEAQISRLLQSPEATATWRHFYTQWLRLDRVPGFNPSAVSALGIQYPDQSAPALPANTNLDSLRTDAFEEVVELMTFTSTHGGSLREAITSDVSFARSQALATIYGVAPWSGDESALVRFPAGQRAGLFTRAGYLLSGYPETNPIMRGARLRVEYLCDTIEPPANTSPPLNYVPPAVQTVRNVVAAKTEIAGSACQGCHQSAINPLGFAFEDFDAFGRYRTQEPLIDAQGQVASWIPINAATSPNIDLGASSVQVNGAVQLSAALAESQRLHSCFARHVFRSVEGRHESTSLDACTLDAMERAAGTGSIEDVVRALITSPDFTRRLMPAGN